MKALFGRRNFEIEIRSIDDRPLAPGMVRVKPFYCGVCGTENASRLHYFHVEGDSSHRLQNCDECGQYQRMVFEEDLSIPLSMEVEDVVMAKLDAIALDPRFRVE